MEVVQRRSLKKKRTMKDNQSTENVYPSLSTFDTSTFPTREILEKLLPETWESPIDKVVEGFGWTFSILESLLLSLPNSLHWSRDRCILRQQDSNSSFFFIPVGILFVASELFFIPWKWNADSMELVTPVISGRGFQSFTLKN